MADAPAKPESLEPGDRVRITNLQRYPTMSPRTGIVIDGDEFDSWVRFDASGLSDCFNQTEIDALPPHPAWYERLNEDWP
jgi:hypothetical protein